MVVVASRIITVIFLMIWINNNNNNNNNISITRYSRTHVLYYMTSYIREFDCATG
jgi:hypothetical protein